MPTSLDDLDLRVYVDYPQDRRNRIGPFLLAADGAHLDDSTAVNCIIDPVTQSILPTPLPMTPEWRTTTTGNYARLTKADYTFSSPATASDWLDYDFRVTGDTYLISASADAAKKSASVKVTGGLLKNQPMFLSFSKQDKQESNSQYILKLFWQSTVEFPNYDVGLFFKSDGGVDLHRGYVTKNGLITFTTSSTTVTGLNTKFNTAISSSGDGLQVNSKLYTIDGQLIGTVSSITNDTTLVLTAAPKFNSTSINWFAKNTTSDSMKMVKSYSRTEQNFNANKTLKPLNNPNGNFNDVFIIPCRGKDLLVFSSYGLNFCHTFDDLDDPYSPPKLNSNDVNAPVITPKGDFAVVVPTGNCSFQLAKLKFKSSWFITTKSIELDNSYLENSSLLFEYPQVAINRLDTWPGGPNFDFYIPYPGNKIYKNQAATTNFNTSWPVNSKIYVIAYSESNGTISTSNSWQVGTINSVTSSLITLNANSNLYTDYFNYTMAKLLIIYPQVGTITWNTSSKTITGTSTAFTTEVSVGHWIFDNNDRLIGQVKSITNNTSLELYDFPCFSSTSASSYWLNLPIHSFNDSNFSSEQTGPADGNSGTALIYSIIDEYGRSVPGDVTNGINTNKEIKIQIAYVGTDEQDANLLYSFDLYTILRPETLNNTQIDITSAVEKLSIGRNADGAMTAALSARKKILTDLGVVKPDILSNRSIKIALKPRTAGYQEVPILEGFMSEPDIEYIQGSNYDNYALLNFEITDKKQQMNELFFSNAPSFEDRLLSYILSRTSDLAAINGKDNFGLFTLLNQDEKTYNFSFDYNRNNSSGQFNNTTTPGLGDSIGSFIESLRNELFSNYTLSVKNKWKFDYWKMQWVNKPTLSLDYNYATKSASDITLYLNEITANTYGSIPTIKGHKRTIRAMSRTYQRPDANRVTVIGIDKNNNDRISVIKSNTNSINPYVAPANRTNDWMGDTRDFVQISPNLNSLKTVEYAADAYFDRLSKSREIIQFTSDFLTLFDSTSTNPNPEYWKTGTIYYDTSTNTITGYQTLFTEQISINDKLYANGTTLIGTVASITDDDTLVLTTSALVSGNSIKWTNKVLTGTISTLDYSTGVTGTGTLFTTQLAINDYIYNPSTGQIIGQVASITNNTSLTLVANATQTLSNTTFTKTLPYLALNQFKFIDNSDVITIKDLNNTTMGDYIVNSWQCDFVKDYTNATADEIVVRNCVYQVQKTDLQTIVPVNQVSEFNEDYDNVNNVFVGVNSIISLYFYCEKDLTAALISPPSGMTVTKIPIKNNEKSNAYLFQIQWNPTSAFQNYVTTVELQLTPTGQSPVSYFYKFRVFSS